MEEPLEIVFRSLAISGAATLISSAWSVPLAYTMVKAPRFRLVASLLEGLVGIPTVLVGLFLYMLLSNSGPLGPLRLLYTPQAVVIGQAILITPLIASVSYRVLSHRWASYGELALSLGADERQAMELVLLESAPGLLSAVIMGFSRALGELGVALMVGGNIRGYTRVMTTAIALEVSKGEFELAVNLGLVLIALIMIVSITVRLLGRFEG